MAKNPKSSTKTAWGQPALAKFGPYLIGPAAFLLLVLFVWVTWTMVSSGQLWQIRGLVPPAWNGQFGVWVAYFVTKGWGCIPFVATAILILFWLAFVGSRVASRLGGSRRVR